ncbi:hypothetical protein SAMN04487848_0773 [Microbacterium sp. ru370.1]|nr:hypothetical protein SAMN04487848_0773 [Microbacterium sp. ru370.1]SIT79634.1 hypothetical protein SAMN05880579_0769 [Microbacterium sp. RU1D]
MNIDATLARNPPRVKMRATTPAPRRVVTRGTGLREESLRPS